MRGFSTLRAALLVLLVMTTPGVADERPGAIVWQGWSDAVFLQARRVNRPVLLFLQAAWCGECRAFEEAIWGDPEVRRTIQEGFIPVRVDSDRRPDIFRRYQRGGIPSVAFLLPSGHALMFQDGDDLLPAGGSRFTPVEMRRYLALVRKVHGASGPALEQAAEERFRQLVARRNRESRSLGRDMAEVAGNALLRAEDPIYGGLQGVRLVQQEFIQAALTRFALGGDGEQRAFARRSLDALARSPVRDPIEGGFYQAAGAADWDLPAPGFLLAQQGEMLDLFLEAWGIFHDPADRDVAAELCDFILERFHVPELSGLRASIFPTAGHGPAWSSDELGAALSPKQLRVAAAAWGLPAAAGEPAMAPRLAHPLEEVAATLQMAPGRIDALLGKVGRRLAAARESRDRPAVDDTILTGWSARAAAALLRASAILEREDARAVALAVLEYIDEELTSVRDGVFHGMEVRPAREIPVVLLEDQLAVAAAWMTAYELTGDPAHRDRAEARLAFVTDRFREASGQGFMERLATVADVGELRVADRRLDDNARAAELLLRMAALRPGHPGRAQARATLEAFADEFLAYGVLAATFGRAVDLYFHEPVRVLVVEAAGDAVLADRLRRAAVAAATPWTVVLTADPSADAGMLRGWDIDPQGRTAAWILGPDGAQGPLTQAAAVTAALQGGER